MLLAQTTQATPVIAYTLNPDLYTCALIDENGAEVPITDEMVQGLCAASEGFFWPAAMTIQAAAHPRTPRWAPRLVTEGR